MVKSLVLSPITLGMSPLPITMVNFCESHFGLDFGKHAMGSQWVTPKGPNGVFWQHSDFGKLTTNGNLFFFEIFTQHVPEE